MNKFLYLFLKSAVLLMLLLLINYYLYTLTIIYKIGGNSGGKQLFSAVENI